MDDYIAKPVSFGDLSVMLNKCLNGNDPEEVPDGAKP